MSLSGQYGSTLATASAVLATKVVLVNMIGARTRLMCDNPAQPEDRKSPLHGFFKLALFCTGPDFGGADFTARCERLCKNCAENEPFFLLLAVIGGLSGRVGDEEVGAKLITAFTVARVVHMVGYFLGPKITIAIRSLAWTVGSASQLGLAFIVITGKN